MRQDGTKKTTIVDISRAAGLSLSTVSEILNNKTKNTYRKSTKERVLRIAAELNYQPNFAAQTLRTQKTLSIGLIVPMLYMELDEIEEAGGSCSLRRRGTSSRSRCRRAARSPRRRTVRPGRSRESRSARKASRSASGCAASGARSSEPGRSRLTRSIPTTGFTMR